MNSNIAFEESKELLRPVNWKCPRCKVIYQVVAIDPESYKHGIQPVLAKRPCGFSEFITWDSPNVLPNT